VPLQVKILTMPFFLFLFSPHKLVQPLLYRLYQWPWAGLLSTL